MHQINLVMRSAVATAGVWQVLDFCSRHLALHVSIRRCINIMGRFDIISEKHGRIGGVLGHREGTRSLVGVRGTLLYCVGI